jgi:hypothetical protein
LVAAAPSRLRRLGSDPLVASDFPRREPLRFLAGEPPCRVEVAARPSPPDPFFRPERSPDDELVPSAPERRRSGR